MRQLKKQIPSKNQAKCRLSWRERLEGKKNITVYLPIGVKAGEDYSSLVHQESEGTKGL